MRRQGSNSVTLLRPLPTPTTMSSPYPGRRPTLAAVAASGHGSTYDLAARACAAAAAIASVSIARGGGPSEVRLGVRRLHMPCMCMHITTY